MKKFGGIIAVIIFIIVMVFIYLHVGKKGAAEVKTYTEDLSGYKNDAQKSVDAMNKNIEESKKAADKMLGK
jgi:predicted PurR-regulated permease PerM